MQKIEELETTLSQFQGLQEVKFSIYAFIQLLKVWKEEEKQNLPYAPVLDYLMILLNNHFVKCSLYMKRPAQV